MWRAELVAEGRHAMTVCNACRYCEAYCPVFQAMEDRLTFAEGDLAYLANLCHNCGECLYACQYAPPHEFGIDVPRTLASIRLASYQEYAWPNRLGGPALVRPAWLALLAIAIAAAVIVPVARGPIRAAAAGDFYRVVPHHVMVAIFGVAGLGVVAALSAAVGRGRRDFTRTAGVAVYAAPDAAETGAATVRGLRDALTLRHLHPAGADCTSAEESRTGWRRWCHHATFYGFVLCLASTTVAAIYHLVFDWRAPYPYLSLPVVLGTAGGIGLVAGPAGLWILGGRRDAALSDPAQRTLDTTLMAMLLLTSLSGLALLAFREGPSMPLLLLIHLVIVLALFLTLPYGKFVHGLHRLTALVKFAGESRRRR